MRLSGERKRQIREFLIRNIPEHSKDIVKLASRELGLSRSSVRTNLAVLESEGIIISSGKTKGITYALRSVTKDFSLTVSMGLSESDVWDADVAPFLPEMNENVRAICNYSFTEMLNNVIDHSESETVYIKVQYDVRELRLFILDQGIGIFKKIQKAKNLTNIEDAILELHKGKITTDPDNHTGEGIFFTSRTLDDFNILSGGLLFHVHEDEDWLYMIEPIEEKGTSVYMKISLGAETRIEDVFERYTSTDEDGVPGFTKTEIMIPLLKKGGSSLVSRSQAKRLVTRLDSFSEIVLNFKGVEWMGQAFADEVFRIFQRRHPDILISTINANQRVLNMIAHVTGGVIQRDLFDRTE